MCTCARHARLPHLHDRVAVAQLQRADEQIVLSAPPPSGRLAPPRAGPAADLRRHARADLLLPRKEA